MWRRACLGSRDDQVQVLLLGLAMASVAGLVAADRVRWWAGPLVAAGLLIALTVLFLWRRRAWDRKVLAEVAAGTAQIEVMLQRRHHRRDT